MSYKSTIGEINTITSRCDVHHELWRAIITYACRKTLGTKPPAPYVLNEVHPNISMSRWASFKVNLRHCDDIGMSVVARRVSKMKVHEWHLCQWHVTLNLPGLIFHPSK